MSSMIFQSSDLLLKTIPASIALLLGAGNVRAQCLTFESPAVIDAQASGDGKAVGDILGNGRGDPILGGSQLAWYESGAGYAKHIIRASPVHTEFSTDMQAADIDGDGDVDIIVGDGGGTGNVLWFENPRLNTPAGVGADPRVAANWTYHVIGTHGDWAHDIEVNDLDGDGAPEVVTSGHNHTWVWKRQASGSWTGRDLSSMAGQGVFLGDIDGDGRADIATHAGWIRTPTDLMTGTWAFYPTSSATGDEVMLADFNGDGRLDAVRCDAHNRAVVRLYVAPANPQQAGWSTSTIDSSMGSHHPEPADFDGDGRMDFVMGLELQELSVYRNLGGSPPTFQKTVLDTHVAHNARVGDLSGDGYLDIFACDYIGNPPAKVFLQRVAVAPTISLQPGEQSCFGGTLALNVAFGARGATTIAWSRNGSVLGNGSEPSGATVSGATTSAITIQGLTPSDSGNYTCVVSDACGARASEALVIASCASDLTCDGGVDVNDLLFFLQVFESGSVAADLDDGSGSGVPDGGVDINDLLFFLVRFEAGC